MFPLFARNDCDAGRTVPDFDYVFHCPLFVRDDDDGNVLDTTSMLRLENNPPHEPFAETRQEANLSCFGEIYLPQHQ